MSRDFELLQRLEREWGRTSSLPDDRTPIASVASRAAALKIAQEVAPAVAHPAASLTHNARSELTKVILSTFLATPARRIVMFTGVEAGDYSKCAAACIADLLADTSHSRVCLIDADQSAPAMHTAFSLANQTGLTDLLAGTCSLDSAAIRAGENLWIIPAGSQLENETIATAAFQQVVNDVLEQCDHIVIAAPDYGSYSEIGAIGPAVEGAVLVLDAAKTRRAKAQDAKAALELARIRVLGSILNNRAYSAPEFSQLRA